MQPSTQNSKNYYKYWGKAEKDGCKYHLLPYHCLDVAAVGSVWWGMSSAIRKVFCNSTILKGDEVRAWLLLFIALHDIGKFDIRFQRKASEIWEQLQWPEYPSRLSANDVRNYFHGPAGLCWMINELDEIIPGGSQNELPFNDDPFDFEWIKDEHNSILNNWKPWLEAVTGHHGHIIKSQNNSEVALPFDCPQQYV